MTGEGPACYHCGAPLREGERRCPDCGRRQYRTCYCGAMLPKTAAVCETCGADWSPARRRRTLRKKRPLRGREVALYAVGGAFLAAILAAGARRLLQTLAAVAAGSQGLPLPSGLGRQLWLVVVGGGRAIGHAAVELASRGWQAVGLLAVMLLGAAAGTIWYLSRTGAIRLKRRRHSRRRRR